MKLFTFDPGLVIWTWVSFGILFFLLSKFVFPSLTENLKNREKTIAKSIDDAAAIQKKLEAIDVERGELLKKANVEADEILLKTRSEMEQLKQRMLKSAEEEASALLEIARKKAAAERETMLHTMRADLADLVCDASEKVVGSAFIGGKERDYSRELVKEL